MNDFDIDINTEKNNDLDILSNIKKIKDKVKSAAEKCGRNPKDIKILAVSKTKPAEYVVSAIKGGITDFGENRPQELAEKYDEVLMIKTDSEDDLSQRNNIRWHQIGQLQKNKVKYIIDKVSLIHSVDSLSLAEEINKRAAAIDKVQDVLIQVNISGEESKSGVPCNMAVDLCKQISDLPNVHIIGLMTISVKGYTYEENRDLFSLLKELAAKLSALNIPNIEMKELSMGMSNDYEAAIEAGATIVRVGSAIFGKRDYGLNGAV